MSPEMAYSSRSLVTTIRVLVVGVHEERRPAPEDVHLRLEGRPLVVVEQGEGVRARARRRDAVAPSGLQVGAGREADHVGGPCRGDGGLLVGAPGAHLDAGPLAGGGHHAGGGRGDGAVVVEHREGERLQEHTFGERSADGEHRGPREVQVALGVAIDVTGELEIGQPVEQPLVGQSLLAQGGDLVLSEAEVWQRLQQPAGAGEDAVPAAEGQAAREHLEDAVALGGAVGEGGGHHREFVAVGEERRGRWGSQPGVHSHDREA
jgi:hypothetical protein